MAGWWLQQALDIVTALLQDIQLEVNRAKTRLTTFDDGFAVLGVGFQGGKYRYEWPGQRVEAQDRSETSPLEIDGHW